jgi:hypothetical protein
MTASTNSSAVSPISTALTILLLDLSEDTSAIIGSATNLLWRLHLCDRSRLPPGLTQGGALSCLELGPRLRQVSQVSIRRRQSGNKGPEQVLDEAHPCKGEGSWLGAYRE